MSEKRINNITKTLIPVCSCSQNQSQTPFPIYLKSKLPQVPFVFFNHADFVFSLCSFSSDYGISFFETSKKINDRYRFKAPSFVLPLYVVGSLDNIVDTKNDNQALKLVIMSSYYKTIPKDEWNIYSAILEIQNLKEISQIDVIGINKKDAKNHVNTDFNKKVRFHGIMANPTKLLCDSDIFIEAYPIGTGLGTIEAILLGNLPIFSVAPFLIYPFGGAINLFPKRLRLEYEQIKSHENYIEFLKSEIVNFNPKKQIRLKEYLVQTHCSNWKGILKNINKSIFENKSGLKDSEFEISSKNETHFAEIVSNVSGKTKRNYKLFYKSFNFFQVLYILAIVNFRLDSKDQPLKYKLKKVLFGFKSYVKFKQNSIFLLK